MASLFVSALSDKPLSASQLPEAVRSYKSRLAYGLLEIGNVGGGCLAFIFSGGEILAVYAYNPAGLIALAPDEWQHIFSPDSRNKYPPAVLRFSPASLRLVHIRLMQYDQSETFQNLPAETLAERLSQWRECMEPTLLHIRWTSADALVMLRGMKHRNEDVVLFTGGQEIPGKTSLADLVEWPDKEYSLTILKRVENKAWDLYLLQAAFACLVETLLRRYREVTGRVMVNSLVRCMNLAAAAHEWNILVAGERVQDRMAFASLDEAETAYRILMQHTFSQMETLLGRNLVLLILKDVLTDMTDTCLQVLRDRQIIPEAYLPPAAMRS